MNYFKGDFEVAGRKPTPVAELRAEAKELRAFLKDRADVRKEIKKAERRLETLKERIANAA
jgi:hypothetical protein